MPLRSLYWSSFVGRLILAAAAPRTRSWDALAWRYLALSALL